MKTTVRKHIRKQGNKKIKVRAHKRKIKIKTNISEAQRRFFTAAATIPDEVGGQLDFEGDKLENAKTHFGSGSTLEFEWNPDYEVSWHTHPKEASLLPSFSDILSMRQTNEKEGLIFNNKLALSIAEERKFRRTPINKIKRITKDMERDYHRGASDNDLFKKYKPIFKSELGLSMTIHKPHKAIKLKSRSV